MNARIEHAVTLWEPEEWEPEEWNPAEWPPGAPPWSYRATLQFDPADPYVVTLQMPMPNAHCDGFDYTFAREFLVDAVELGQATGAGDVRIHSCDGWITIDLYAETHEDDSEYPPLSMQHESAAYFLALTYAAVPVGTEATRINWDAELADVLGGPR